MAKRKNSKFLGSKTANWNWNQSYPGMILGFIVVIVVGLLIYNYFTATKTSGPTIDQTTDQSENSLISSQLPTTYQVAKGDSLSDIAKKFYNNPDSWKLIAEENNLVNPSIIHPGNVLKIPKPKTASNVQPEVPSGIGSDQQTSQTQIVEKPPIKRTTNNYVIKHGDTLWKISQEVYGNPYLWSKIEKANELGRLPDGTSLIHADNILIIPE